MKCEILEVLTEMVQTLVSLSESSQWRAADVLMLVRVVAAAKDWVSLHY